MVELGKETESGRLLRLLGKLSFVTERPELGGDTQWAETGDRRERGGGVGGRVGSSVARLHAMSPVQLFVVRPIHTHPACPLPHACVPAQ